MRGHPAPEKGSAGPTTGTGWEHLRTWGWSVSPGSAFQVPALELGAGPEVGTVRVRPPAFGGSSTASEGGFLSLALRPSFSSTN